MNTEKKQVYLRHSTVDLESVLAAIRTAPTGERTQGERKPRVTFNGVSVKIGSLRLRTFATKGTVCVTCGLKASFFAIETQPFNAQQAATYHLNLWGVNSEGQEVLFTHDHTLARGLGGKDNLTNCQTMCSPCNFAKSIHETDERNRRRNEGVNS